MSMMGDTAKPRFFSGRASSFHGKPTTMNEFRERAGSINSSGNAIEVRLEARRRRVEDLLAAREALRDSTMSLAPGDIDGDTTGRSRAGSLSVLSRSTVVN